MKRSRTSEIDISEFNNKQLKELRREIRKREMELWQDQLIKEVVVETETVLNHWKYGKITYEPIDLPDEFTEKFGECIDVAAEFGVGFFTVCYILTKEPKYITSSYGYQQKNLFAEDSLHIKIKGNTQDGTAYGPSFGPEYADKIEITFSIHKPDRYHDLLNIWKLDKSIHYQDKINLRDKPDACLNDRPERRIGKTGDWNIVFSDDSKVSQQRKLFTQDLVDFWTNFFDNIFF